MGEAYVFLWIAWHISRARGALAQLLSAHLHLAVLVVKPAKTARECGAGDKQKGGAVCPPWRGLARAFPPGIFLNK